MLTNIVLTLTGPDRIGIVDRLTGLLFEHGGNVETSRMARLGGEFAMLMLVAMPAEEFAVLDESLASLTSQGYTISTTPARQTHEESLTSGLPYRIEVQGADHEGIIHEVSHYLAERGINIERAESGTTAAPITGTPLFTMSAQVIVPTRLSGTKWEAGLEEIGQRLNLEIEVSALDVA